MEAIDLIQEIETYRKVQKGTCLSTSHTLTVNEYEKIQPFLFEKYKEFDVEYKNNIVKLTIPINQ